MKLEVGKSYRMRDGRKVFINKNDDSGFSPFRGIIVGYWNKDGTWEDSRYESRRDLIAEWPDEPVIERDAVGVRFIDDVMQPFESAPVHGGRPMTIGAIFESEEPDGAIPMPDAVTLRDQFAMISFREWMRALIDGSVDDLTQKIVAVESYKAADAMLAARRKAGT